ncbi:MAG: 2-dehydropantoate 2-reductase N-terminal domain-containing protein [Pseudomonadota bacterium]
MRVVIYGVGAIGGIVGAALARSGQDVIGIARGAQLDALQTKGLTLRAPGGTFTVPFACVGSPAEVEFRAGDIVCLAMKSQHTEAALEELSRVAPSDTDVFCLQNGIANERRALRRFANTHGVTVMMPGLYLQPGEVTCFVAPCFGIFDIGLYTGGSNHADRAFAEVLNQSNIAAYLSDDVMVSKRGKLLINLGNIIEAALGRGADAGDLRERVRAEGVAVLTAADLDWQDVGAGDARRQKLMKPGPVDGVPRGGGSTSQSLIRGADTLETPYLNGEIALLARLHGVPAPLNAALTRLASELLRQGVGTGSLTLAQLEDWLTAHQTP